MAEPQGERTEKPSAKKLKDASERGQVARSRDLSGAISLAAATLMLGWAGADTVMLLRDRLAHGLMTLGDHARGLIEGPAIVGVFFSDGRLLATSVGPLAVVTAVASVLTSAAQVGWAYSPKALQLNWGRLSPGSGASRLKPLQVLPDLAKALIGVTVIGALCYVFVTDVYTEAPRLMSMTSTEAAITGWNRLWTLLWRTSLALGVIGSADYAVQRWRWFSQLKMTRQEARDEARSNEGNPEIKSRVRKVQREMTRRRMLQSVKTATVVITNPTHVAVALEYRRHEMAAPVVLAKGQDELALRIRTIAREAGVPIVENVSLARALYNGADVGDAIPAALFGAVAEVLAYLVRLKQLML